MDQAEKILDVQRQARGNVKVFQNYMTDLQNWEIEMKRKEAALNGQFEQDLPPVRSKISKEKPIKEIKTPAKRISSSDYSSWEKFDADKACEDIEMEDVGPTSLDSKKSEQIKQEKLKEEALYEKKRGNAFVKLEQWDEAISCYNRAIELVKDDPIYYANRGLCYLKKDSLHHAESDCTEALRLDPTYVKALQRRATARAKLGSLRAASHDLDAVLKIEPQNAIVRRQLQVIKARMGTKGSKSKSSPAVTPILESKSLIPVANPKISNYPKITDSLDEKTGKVKNQQHFPAVQKWLGGLEEGITVIKPVKKPPHLRSKRSLKHIEIQEIQLGKMEPEKPGTRMKITEIDNDMSHGDSNNNNESIKTVGRIIKKQDIKEKGDSNTRPESEKLDKELVTEKMAKNVIKEMVPPVNSVQFMAEWKSFEGVVEARSKFLSIIDPARIPAIFDNALESSVLSELIHTLYENVDRFKDKTVSAYLRALCQVKRFSALAMFLSESDKRSLTILLEYCGTVEGCSADEIADLKNKYEL